MIKHLVWLGLVSVAVAALVAGCTSALAPAPTPMPSPRVTAVVRLPSPVLATTVTAKPTARPAPPPQPGPGSVISLGVPAGDSYTPTDLAVDPTQKLAYVYHARSTQGGPVIAVVDLLTNRVTRQIVLAGFSATGSGGRLFVAPTGTHAFVTDQDSSTLVVVDLVTGTAQNRIDGVREAALSPDGQTLYVIDQGTVRAIDTSPSLPVAGFTARWQVDLPGASQLMARNERVLISRSLPAQDLVLLDGASGRTLATHPLPEYSQALALGPNRGWAVRTGGTPPQVQRFDADLRLEAATTVADWGAFYYDEPRNRYILTGYRSSPQPDMPSNPVIVTLAAGDLLTQTETVWTAAMAPDLFLAYGQDQLLGVDRYTGAALMTLDPARFAPATRAILGVQLTAAALDTTTATLYVADNQERIHVFDWPGGTERAIWSGAAPIALDAANKRLYVNRPGHVVALDAMRGTVLAEFDRSGFPAPDSLRDWVYIANAGVTIYDRTGREVGRLDKTFPIPQGFVPNPYAIAAYVNPVNGYLFVEMNNGVPGSNNSSFLQIYVPGRDSPLAVPAPYNFMTDIIFDPIDGTSYVSYAGKGSDMIQRLNAAGEETGRLLGRTGLLMLDRQTGRLRVHYRGVLAAVDTASLALLGVDHTGRQVDQVLFDPAHRWLVVRDENNSHLDMVALDQLSPLTMFPQARRALPDRPMSDLQASTDDRGHVLYSRVDNQVFRSRDGERWEQVPVGSWDSYGHLTTAGPGVLFYTNLAEGGSDGVLRSRDGGDTWEFLNAGLSDLRLAQPLAAIGADTVYAADRSGRLLAWRPGVQRWEVILTPPDPYTALGTLALAPDGTLLLLSYDRFRRSTDGGQTWADLPVPGPGGSIVGFSDGYADTPAVYGFFGIDDPFLARSRDGGLSWEPLPMAPAIRPYASNFRFAVAGKTLYMFTSDDAGNARLVRSLDEGESWQEADAAQVLGSQQMALAPDGRLWLGMAGRAQGVDPAALRWAAASAPSGDVRTTPVENSIDPVYS